MNAKTMAIIVAGTVLAFLVGVSAAAGYWWSDSNHADDMAEHNAKVLAYQQALYDHQAEINRTAAVQAELVSAANSAEHDRIAALEVTDEQSGQIENLKTRLADLVKRQQESAETSRVVENIDPGDLIVVRGHYLERLWSGIVHSGGQTTGPAAGAVQTQLSAVAEHAGGTDWALANNRGRYWCDAEKCCGPIQPVQKFIQRAVANL